MIVVDIFQIVTNQVNCVHVGGWVNCCWPSAAQSFVFPSPAGLMPLYYRHMDEWVTFFVITYMQIFRYVPYWRTEVPKFSTRMSSAGCKWCSGTGSYTKRCFVSHQIVLETSELAAQWFGCLFRCHFMFETSGFNVGENLYRDVMCYDTVHNGCQCFGGIYFFHHHPQ
jgi:hypothetical protein